MIALKQRLHFAVFFATKLLFLIAVNWKISEKLLQIDCWLREYACKRLRKLHRSLTFNLFDISKER